MKEVAKIYEINPKSLQRWINKGFRKIKGKKKYIKQINIGAGRKIRDSSMEKELLYYYHIVKGGKVTTREFKKKAMEFSKYPTFKASKGWLQKFRRRNKIELNKK